MIYLFMERVLKNVMDQCSTTIEQGSDA